MNIQLLEEIEELRSQEMSDSDIASMLGITKANMLLMLRIKKVVESSLGSKLDNLQKENTTLKEQLNHLKEQLNHLKEQFPKIYNLDEIIEQNEEIPHLKEKIEDLRYRLEDLKEKNDNLSAKLFRIPFFIKKIFAIE